MSKNQETLQMPLPRGWKKQIRSARHNTLISMHNLACGYLEADGYQKAIQLFEAMLILQRKVLGPKHPQTLEGMRTLAQS